MVCIYIYIYIYIRNEENAGGCHLNADPYESGEASTWKNNPKYLLVLKEGLGKNKCKITLSRPETTWKQKIAKVN